MPNSATSHLLPVFARVDLGFERGEGAWLISTSGERYLDFTSGVAVNALGHCHPHLVAALQEQATRLWHMSNLFKSPDGEKLAARLCEQSFADLVFFCNSGAEAIECVIKVTRKYHAAKGHPERYRIITFEGAFHGRTRDLFAYKRAGVTPDVMALAKALGGGFPIGACLATAEAASGMTPGSHGSTFGGNPLAVSAANAVLDVMLKPGFFDHAQKMSLLLKQ